MSKVSRVESPENLHKQARGFPTIDRMIPFVERLLWVRRFVSHSEALTNRVTGGSATIPRRIDQPLWFVRYVERGVYSCEMPEGPQDKRADCVEHVPVCVDRTTYTAQWECERCGANLSCEVCKGSGFEMGIEFMTCACRKCSGSGYDKYPF